MRLLIIITRSLYLCVLGLTLAACGSNKSAPIEERKVITQAQVDERIGGQLIRIVQPGDTLYSIAFALNLDAKKIALWNGITDTSKLSVGKRVRLTEPIGFQYPEKPVAKTSVSGLARSSKYGTNTDSRSFKPGPDSIKSETLSSKKASVVDVNSRVPVKTTALKSELEGLEEKSESKVNGSQVSQSAKAVASNTVVKWQWPMRGTLVGRFNLSKGQQGINIQGQRGQAVFTAAPGEVVYAGDSLRGYGNLVIVKHSNDYLSAYAHNQEILVKEGDTLDAGQQLARLGYNLTGAPVSQFQIRKNGVPVDPLKYLEGV